MARAVNMTRMWSPGQSRVILTNNLAMLRMSHGPETRRARSSRLLERKHYGSPADPDSGQDVGS
jgi:hypothetical protein